MPLGGEIALVEGRKLLIGGPNPRQLTVPLGRDFAASFTLTASTEGGTEEDDLTLVDYLIQEPAAPARDMEPAAPARDGPNWLRVLTPARADLPLTIRPRNPEQLVVEVHTRGLDRQRFAGALLRGSVELLDSRKRRWTCEIHATVTRPPRLSSFVAIDWGTTNSCAAYCTGAVGSEPPRSLSFDEEQQRAPELFPSDIYFSDLSDPENPVFFLGHEAARRAREHPECCLRSVKRKFQFLDRVFVMDEQQRSHTYPMDRLVELLLERLVTLAETAQGQEIHLYSWRPSRRSGRPGSRHKLERVKPRRHGRPAAARPPALSGAGLAAAN